jgi:hypothetical protein
MASSSICPAVPEYYEEESDDEEGVITVGYQEYKDSRLEAFRSAAPYRIDVPVQFRAIDGSKIISETLRVLTDKHLALNEVYAATAQSWPCMWLEAAPTSVFTPLRENIIFEDKSVFVSDQVREIFTWCGVINALPHLVLADQLNLNAGAMSGDPMEAQGFLSIRVHFPSSRLSTNDLSLQLICGSQTAKSKWSSDESLILLWDGVSPLIVQATMKESNESIDSATIELLDLVNTKKLYSTVSEGLMAIDIAFKPSMLKSNDSSVIAKFSTHLRKLFPAVSPRFAVYIGGNMTPEKLRVMDRLIDSVNLIIISFISRKYNKRFL